MNWLDLQGGPIIEMGEYLAPYVSTAETFKNMTNIFEKNFKGSSSNEGFTDIANVFQNMLQTGSAPGVTRPACSQSSSDGTGTNCPPTSTTVTTSSSQGGSSTQQGTSTSFLKSLLEKERAAVDSLMDTAKRIRPVVQTLEPVAEASDAAFEASTPAGIPKPGATLQGFAVILLVLSYVAFTIVFTIFINHTTQNPYTTGKTFVGLLILAFILYTLIIRLG